MPPKYKRLIGDYCARNGVDVPPDFARHTPSRYGIIRAHLTPPKLIAQTWFNKTDLIYYIERFLLPELGEGLSQSIRILDFKDDEVLSYTAMTKLLVFYFEEIEVGHFTELAYPQRDGLYRYKPYRGQAQIEMKLLRQDGVDPRCYYYRDGIRVSFLVRNCPKLELDMLELYDLDRSQIAV